MSEKFWKEISNVDDMKKYIIWNAEDDVEFNKNTPEDCFKISEALNLYDNKKKLVLDYGCGIGRLAKGISTANIRIAGVDVNHEMVKTAYKYCEGYNAIFVLSENGHTIPAHNNVFDHAYSHIVLQHVNKHKVYLILKDFLRVLKPGGTAFIQLPNFFKCLQTLDSYALTYLKGEQKPFSDMNFWTGREIKVLLEFIGFVNINVIEEGTDLFVKFQKVDLEAVDPENIKGGCINYGGGVEVL